MIPGSGSRDESVLDFQPSESGEPGIPCGIRPYKHRAFDFVSSECRSRVRSHPRFEHEGRASLTCDCANNEKLGRTTAVRSNYSGFSATIHKQVTASTGFAQRGRTLLLMNASPCEKVQSLQAWMTRCQ